MLKESGFFQNNESGECAFAVHNVAHPGLFNPKELAQLMYEEGDKLDGVQKLSELAGFGTVFVGTLAVLNRCQHACFSSTFGRACIARATSHALR